MSNFIRRALLAVGLAVAAGSALAAQYEAMLLQSHAEQERIFRAGINSAGYPCPKVTAVMFMGHDRQAAGNWAVACSDGGNWMVSILDDTGGTMVTTPCSILKIANIDCWKKF